LYGSSQQRRAGVEILSGTPVAVGMGGEGKFEHVSLADLRDAILIRTTELHWLITPFECVMGGSYQLLGQGRRRYRIEALKHSHADYRVYACRQLELD
jgi:hypothetical protein